MFNFSMTNIDLKMSFIALYFIASEIMLSNGPYLLLCESLYCSIDEVKARLSVHTTEPSLLTFH